MSTDSTTSSRKPITTDHEARPFVIGLVLTHEMLQDLARQVLSLEQLQSHLRVHMALLKYYRRNSIEVEILSFFNGKNADGSRRTLYFYVFDVIPWFAGGAAPPAKLPIETIQK